LFRQIDLRLPREARGIGKYADAELAVDVGVAGLSIFLLVLSFNLLGDWLTRKYRTTGRIVSPLRTDRAMSRRHLSRALF
jgi:hypothetical protein